jgi:hypothetical protein
MNVYEIVDAAFALLFVIIGVATYMACRPLKRKTFCDDCPNPEGCIRYTIQEAFLDCRKAAALPERRER